MAAVTNPLQQKAGDVVYVRYRDGSGDYGVRTPRNGLEKVFLDASSYIHRTGLALHVPHSAKTTFTLTWRHTNKQYITPYAGDDEDEQDPRHQRVHTSVMGPISSSYPPNEGWYMRGQSPRMEATNVFGDNLAAFPRTPFTKSQST